MYISCFPRVLPPCLGGGQQLGAVLSPLPSHFSPSFCAPFVWVVLCQSPAGGQGAVPASWHLRAWQIAIELLLLSFESHYKKRLTRSNANSEVF